MIVTDFDKLMYDYDAWYIRNAWQMPYTYRRRRAIAIYTGEDPNTISREETINQMFNNYVKLLTKTAD